MNFLKRLFKSQNTVQNRPINTKPDIDELLQAEDQNLSIIALDDYICGLLIYGDDLSHLSAEQRNFYYIQELERDVNNGGFNQYFYNSSGDTACEVVQALKAIGANRTSEIVQKAIDQFPEGKVPKYRAARQHILEQIEEDSDQIWEELTQEFFNYDDDLNELNMLYVKANKNSF